jgi:hypothetical protein
MKMAQIVAVLIYMHNSIHGEKPTMMTEKEAERIESFPNWKHEMKAGKSLLDLSREGLLDPIFAHFGVTMKVEHHEPRIFERLSKDGYAKLDFLGYGVALIPELRQLVGRDVYLCVLDHERILKMLAFRKSEYGEQRLDALSGHIRELVSTLMKL